MITLDGGTLEAGGQIVRTATALSAITKKPCHIFNIRKNRPAPGLMHQHLLGIQALAQFCSGRLEGDKIGSQEIKFYPEDVYKENVFSKDRISIKIPTAGSITLVLQTLIPPALFAPKPIEIYFEGGATETFFSPTIDHFRYVFLKILEKMEGKVEIDIIRRGYYPEGGAKVNVKIFPSKLKNLNLPERGELKKIVVLSGASEFLKNKNVAKRQIAGIREVPPFSKKYQRAGLPMEEKVEYYETESPGSQICLVAEFENTIIGTDNLGKLGKRAEDVGREAALELLREEKTGACLDKHLADQILPYLALASGMSQVAISEFTPHCQTNVWVIEKFIDGKFEIKDNLITWMPKKV